MLPSEIPKELSDGKRLCSYKHMMLKLLQIIYTHLNFEIFIDRVMYARKAGEESGVASTNLGGEKISVEDACVSCDLVKMG